MGDENANGITYWAFWLTDTMYGESVLFLKDDPGSSPRALLLFPPVRVLAVRDPSGEVTYAEGRDYVWKPATREIVLPPGSAIAFRKPQDLRRPAQSQPYAFTHRDGNSEILFGGGHEYHDSRRRSRTRMRGMRGKGRAHRSRAIGCRGRSRSCARSNP